jgi:hypothetical protein
MRTCFGFIKDFDDACRDCFANNSGREIKKKRRAPLCC